MFFLNKILKKIGVFISLTFKEKVAFFEAFFLLAYADVLIHFFPFSYVRNILEKKVHRIPTTHSPEIVKESIRRARQIALWQPMCYAQALTAKLMLARRGIQCTLLLGTKKDHQGKFAAHAWTMSNDGFITGEAGYEEYSVVAKFV